MNTDDVALYTSSTLALTRATGELAWHYAHAPGEAFDLDVVFERVLVDAGSEKWVFSVGKDGVLWKHDRRTGEYLGHKETVFQNVWASFDRETGRPRYRPTSSSTRSANGSTRARARPAARTGTR